MVMREDAAAEMERGAGEDAKMGGGRQSGFCRMSDPEEGVLTNEKENKEMKRRKNEKVDREAKSIPPNRFSAASNVPTVQGLIIPRGDDIIIGHQYG